jgi:flagellar capping protein FliD
MGTGLSSGIDYSTMITQLMQIEARPQNLLRNQLTTTNTAASAYRKLNTAMASLSSAAQAVTGAGMTSSRKATSSSTTVAATAGATAVPGSSLSFSVTQLASAQTSVSAGVWGSATADARSGTATDSTTALPGWPMSVVKGGKSVGVIDLPANATLADAAAKINASGYGLSADVIQLDTTHFKLQVSSTGTGTDAAFSLQSAADPSGATFTATVAARNAKLDLGNSMTAQSSSNTFDALLTGVSVTVSQVSPPTVAGGSTLTTTTIGVANDTSAVTAKVKAMMDAANTALTTISSLTDSSDGSDAALKGNWTLNNLASRILTEVSSAVGASSPAAAGISLTKDGAITFDAAKFSSALAADPALAQRIVGGSTGAGADNVDHSPDDTIDVDGIAARLSVLAEGASDSASGMLTSMANSQDTRAKDLQKQIDDWGLRLTSRQAALTTQFNAMEKALGSLQNQSKWLTSQLDSLPSWSSSKS